MNRTKTEINKLEVKLLVYMDHSVAMNEIHSVEAIRALCDSGKAYLGDEWMLDYNNYIKDTKEHLGLQW